MSLRKSDYSIEYKLMDEMPYHNILIKVNAAFADYLKNSKPNKDKYDEIVLNAMRVNNLQEFSPEDVEKKCLCNWDNGLLSDMMFSVGNAVGLVIEHDTDWGTIYRSHNLDSIANMSVLMTVITNYLSSMSMFFSHSNSERGYNYRIRYTINDKIPYHDISVEISEDFLKSLKNLDVNQEYYEKLAIDAMRSCNVDLMFIDLAKKEAVCKWDGGLLSKIVLPYGDASSLIIDYGTPYGDIYRSHNLNGHSQMAVLMAVITSYLSDMDDMLSFDL